MELKSSSMELTPLEAWENIFGPGTWSVLKWRHASCQRSTLSARAKIGTLGTYMMDQPDNGLESRAHHAQNKGRMHRKQ